MYYVCKGCDDCCRDCCKCCEETCGEYCDALAKCFSTPFSFCTLISSIVTILPFILMVIAIIQSKQFDCQEQIKLQIIIQGICNLLNFLFCVYLMCQYGKTYDNDVLNKREHAGPEEFNIMQRTVNLILYDFVVCFYIFFIIFFLIWTFIGFSWNNDEPSNSFCRIKNNGFIMTADTINLWAMLIFLIVGFIVFIYVLLIYSCDDGSCTSGDFCRCCILVCTCGLCDTGKQHKQKHSKLHAQENKKNYKSSRIQWISSSKRMCGCLGFSRKQDHQYQYNQNTVEMNQNVQMQNYSQQVLVQQSYQVNQVPPKKKSSKNGCLHYLFGGSSHQTQEQQSQNQYQYQQAQRPPPVFINQQQPQQVYQPQVQAQAQAQPYPYPQPQPQYMAVPQYQQPPPNQIFQQYSPNHQQQQPPQLPQNNNVYQMGQGFNQQQNQNYGGWGK